MEGQSRYAIVAIPLQTAGSLRSVTMGRSLTPEESECLGDMTRSTLARRSIALLVVLVAARTPLRGQATTAFQKPDSSPPPPPAPAAAPALPFDFSGVSYTNFQAEGLQGARAQDRSDLDRVYLTLRGNAGEHVS